VPWYLVDQVTYNREHDLFWGQKQEALGSFKDANDFWGSVKKPVPGLIVHWLFRLILEYARLVDDGRNEIGFKLS